jgi:hypothetical protein
VQGEKQQSVGAKLLEQHQVQATVAQLSTSARQYKAAAVHAAAVQACTGVCSPLKVLSRACSSQECQTVVPVK